MNRAKQREDTSFKVIHDFNEEKYPVMVLGGFIIVKKPVCYFLLNIIGITVVYCLYVYLIAMAIVTMAIISNEKEVLVMVFQTLCLLFDGVLLPLIRFLTDKSLLRARQAIKNGVFRYTDGAYDGEQLRIKSERVYQVRFILSWLGRLLFANALANTVFIPLVQLVVVNPKTDGLLNPYLPIPVYMPFDTRNPLGYCIAFLTYATFWCFVSLSSYCVEQTYLSCALQLIAQLEILNHSLKNMEQRTYRRYTNIHTHTHLKMSRELYENRQFQECIYFCLKENIRHHQAILRLVSEIRPFVEGMNCFIMFLFSLILASSCILLIQNPSLNLALAVTLISDVLCYFQMCFVGQVITDKSAEIKDAVFSTPWYNSDKKFKLLLKIMLENSQKPIVFRTTGFSIKISLETFGEMISAAYKIMNLLG